MLIQQSISSLHRHKIPTIMLKIDIAKAFDLVSWPFLLQVLRHRGFGARWIRRLTMLLHTSSTQVLVNGNASESFCHACGLRQGDPLSPLLFIIVMDVLTAIFRKADSADLFGPLVCWGIHHRLSLYVDDAVLLLRPLLHEMVAAKTLLACFGAALGLHCNFIKSSMSPIRCSVDELQEIVTASGCCIKELPITYLGLPLSLVALTKAQLQPLIDNIAAQLPTWRASLLKRDGRLVLVNSKLTAMPIFHMMALDLPPWFFKCVHKLRHGFF